VHTQRYLDEKAARFADNMARRYLGHREPTGAEPRDFSSAAADAVSNLEKMNFEQQMAHLDKEYSAFKKEHIDSYKNGTIGLDNPITGRPIRGRASEIREGLLNKMVEEVVRDTERVWQNPRGTIFENNPSYALDYAIDQQVQRSNYSLRPAPLHDQNTLWSDLHYAPLTELEVLMIQNRALKQLRTNERRRLGGN
jgi:hypothetical protein